MELIDEEHRWRRSDRVVQADVGDTTIIMCIESGRYFTLNDTASAIWKLIERDRTFNEIRQALALEFDIEGDAADRGIENILADWDRQKLVVPFQADNAVS
jgi:hypothetical protein